MAKSFGLFLKTYVGDSSIGREAARHWRIALMDDYLKASQYTNPDDVRRRLAQRGRLHSKVYQGLDVVWLEFRAQQRAAALRPQRSDWNS